MPQPSNASKPISPAEPINDLLGLCRQGDQAAWRRLVASYRLLVRHAAHRRLVFTGRCHCNEEDVCQNVWLTVWKKLRTRPMSFLAEGQFSTWLTRIADAKALHFLRNSLAARRACSRERHDDFLAVECPQPRPDQLALTNDSLDAWLARVGNDDRPAAAMLAEGYSVRQMAITLKLCERTVARKLGRIRSVGLLWS